MGSIVQLIFYIWLLLISFTLFFLIAVNDVHSSCAEECSTALCDLIEAVHGLIERQWIVVVHGDTLAKMDG